MEDSMASVHVRQLEPGDYDFIIPVVNAWWGGRAMRDMLPRLFFTHFCRTSLAAERGGQIVGFLTGFVSQCLPEEAYIHFAGVHPDWRRAHVGRALYGRFFEAARALGCRRVRCVTSPRNAASIGFHLAMGFSAEATGTMAGGMPVAQDYDGPGEDRVLLYRAL